MEPVWTNYPIPPSSPRGNHCPSRHVPDGSSNVFDPEAGRLEIDFYDVGFGHSRTFVLDLRDPACFEEAATRRALFIELVVYMDTTGDYAGTCRRLREAIRRGSLRLGEVPFDMRPAQPYTDEVCPSVRSAR